MGAVTAGGKRKGWLDRLDDVSSIGSVFRRTQKRKTASSVAPVRSCFLCPTVGNLKMSPGRLFIRRSRTLVHLMLDIELLDGESASGHEEPIVVGEAIFPDFPCERASKM